MRFESILIRAQEVVLLWYNDPILDNNEKDLIQKIIEDISMDFENMGHQKKYFIHVDPGALNPIEYWHEQAYILSPEYFLELLENTFSSMS